MEEVLILLGIAYFVMVIFLYFGLRPSAVVYDEKPLPVSVIIAAHNEADTILPCLFALTSQNYPQEFYEIIVVDDRSEDDTAIIVSAFAADHPIVRLLRITDLADGFAPKKRALQMAIEQAKFEYLAFTDADGRPLPGWLAAISAHYSAGADMILGYAPYTLSRNASLPARMLALEYLSHQAIAAATSNLGFPATCVGTNLAYRKEMFNDLNGFGRFRTVLSGDDDLFLNLARESGKYKIVYMTNPDSHVFNDPPGTLAGFIQQRIRYASKGFRYQMQLIIPLVLFVLFNILILAGLWIRPSAALVIFILKFIIDGLFLRKAGRILGDTRSISAYALTAVLHVPYVVSFAILGQLINYKWGK